MLEPKFFADAVAKAANDVLSIQNTASESLSVWWWVGIGVIAVLFVLYRMGKRVDRGQAKVFFERINGDLERLLKGAFYGSEKDLKQQLSELWRHNPLVDFGTNVLRIELALKRQFDNVVECQTKVVAKNTSNEVFEGTATRTYDWDYLPTDVSNILIRSGGKSTTLILYPVKNDNN